MPVQDPRMLIQALRGFNPAPVINADTIPATSLARIRDERGRQADDLSQFDRMPISSGPANSVLAGVMRGISKYQMRNNQEAKLEDLYAQYEEAERAKAQQMAQAKAMQAKQAQQAAIEGDLRKRSLDRSDKQWEWANKPVNQLTPQDQLAMQQTQAQIASIMQQMDMRSEANERAEAKAGREAQEAQSAAEGKADTQAMIADRIDYLLDPQNRESMERATGPIDSMMPTLRQGTADWEDAFNFVQSGLTSDIMDMMTGVLSESDIKMLKSIASGGVTLRSSPELIIPTLERFRKALRGEPVSYGVERQDGATMPSASASPNVTITRVE